MIIEHYIFRASLVFCKNNLDVIWIVLVAWLSDLRDLHAGRFDLKLYEYSRKEKVYPGVTSRWQHPAALRPPRPPRPDPMSTGLFKEVLHPMTDRDVRRPRSHRVNGLIGGLLLTAALYVQTRCTS